MRKNAEGAGFPARVDDRPDIVLRRAPARRCIERREPGCRRQIAQQHRRQLFVDAEVNWPAKRPAHAELCSFLASELPFAKSFARMSEIRQLP